MILEKEYIKNTSTFHRKKYAQFFTPEPVARLMVRWLSGGNDYSNILEPAFGLGIFTRLILQEKPDVKITGFDVDPVIFNAAHDSFKNYRNIKLYLEDYLFNDWDNKYDRIICNPPYFKFHNYENIKSLIEFRKRLNIRLSGFTNIYTLFLLKSIYQLNKEGRIAYIVPSEFLNSDYGKIIKGFLLKSNLLRYVIIFDFKNNVFDNALTTSAILLLSKDQNNKKITFFNINDINEIEKIEEIINNYPDNTGKKAINQNDLDPEIKWRFYYQKQTSNNFNNLIPFNRVAKVVRGIATGSNEYFTFSRKKAEKYKIKEKYLLPCITKSKDVNKPFFTKEDFVRLKNNDAKVYLFNATSEYDINVSQYLKLGERLEINTKYLTSKRNPWYSIEHRPPSPIWVSVFNRNGMKFVKNEANIRNLTTFHCVYPVKSLFNEINIDLLFAYLLTDVAKNIFDDNRREYGDGLKKFEPNDLNNALMLDLSVLDKDTIDFILDLYFKYRISVINNQTDNIFLEKINEIFIKKYRTY